MSHRSHTSSSCEARFYSLFDLRRDVMRPSWFRTCLHHGVFFLAESVRHVSGAHPRQTLCLAAIGAGFKPTASGRVAMLARSGCGDANPAWVPDPLIQYGDKRGHDDDRSWPLDKIPIRTIFRLVLSTEGALARRRDSGTGCGACGRGSQPRTRAAPGLRPPGHYEPAARSSLTERRKCPREARPGAGDRLKGDESHRRGGAPGGVRARPRRAPRLMSAELVAPSGAPPPSHACRACPICGKSRGQ